MMVEPLAGSFDPNGQDIIIRPPVQYYCAGDAIPIAPHLLHLSDRVHYLGLALENLIPDLKRPMSILGRSRLGESEQFKDFQKAYGNIALIPVEELPFWYMIATEYDDRDNDRDNRRHDQFWPMHLKVTAFDAQLKPLENVQIGWNIIRFGIGYHVHNIKQISHTDDFTYKILQKTDYILTDLSSLHAFLPVLDTIIQEHLGKGIHFTSPAGQIEILYSDSDTYKMQAFIVDKKKNVSIMPVISLDSGIIIEWLPIVEHTPLTLERQFAWPSGEPFSVLPIIVNTTKPQTTKTIYTIKKTESDSFLYQGVIDDNFKNITYHVTYPNFATYQNFSSEYKLPLFIRFKINREATLQKPSETNVFNFGFYFSLDPYYRGYDYHRETEIKAMQHNLLTSKIKFGKSNIIKADDTFGGFVSAEYNTILFKDRMKGRIKTHQHPYPIAQEQALWHTDKILLPCHKSYDLFVLRPQEEAAKTYDQNAIFRKFYDHANGDRFYVDFLSKENEFDWHFQDHLNYRKYPYDNKASPETMIGLHEKQSMRLKDLFLESYRLDKAETYKNTYTIRISSNDPDALFSRATIAPAGKNLTPKDFQGTLEINTTFTGLDDLVYHKGPGCYTNHKQSIHITIWYPDLDLGPSIQCQVPEFVSHGPIIIATPTVETLCHQNKDLSFNVTSPYDYLLVWDCTKDGGELCVDGVALAWQGQHEKVFSGSKVLPQQKLSYRGSSTQCQDLLKISAVRILDDGTHQQGPWAFIAGVTE